MAEGTDHVSPQGLGYVYLVVGAHLQVYVRVCVRVFTSLFVCLCL